MTANLPKTPPSGPALDEDRIARDAAAWIARRDRGLDPKEVRTLDRWLSADPRHACEFERLSQAWRSLDGIHAEPNLNALADDVLVRAHARRRSRLRMRFETLTAAAAACVFAAIVGWSRWHAPSRSGSPLLPSENYRVLASTAQRNVLPDGSVAEVNGDSRIEVDFSAAVRRVRLLSGEAHFTVAPNPERPFIVMAGSVAVRAVGTAFNVRLASERIEVLVTEGKVKVAPDTTAKPERQTAAAISDTGQPLVQGQKAVISRSSENGAAAVAVGDVGRAEIDDELGWQSTRLVFNNTPLDEVIAGFNQYNTHRLTLGDPKLRQRTLTGVFRADNLEGFVRLLRASVDVRAEQRSGDETVLLPVR